MSISKFRSAAELLHQQGLHTRFRDLSSGDSLKFLQEIEKLQQDAASYETRNAYWMNLASYLREELAKVTANKAEVQGYKNVIKILRKAEIEGNHMKCLGMITEAINSLPPLKDGAQ